MSKFYRISIVFFLSLMTGTIFSQQLPDPGFENWDGEQFANNPQPKYWNFSNVSQMGVNKNFAHKTTGRSGSALKIQDQFVGFGSIGATSPGYVALGVPWAYISDLTSIEDATAGTYGGIKWTYRPDSMVVWIKRYYDSSVDQAAGNHIKDENFNLLYYAWSGTSQGESYKAKNLSCTNLTSAAPTYCVDEESDIRIALNGNECATKVPGKQIAEGWYYEKKEYANWTRIAIPIYYFNDDAPEKCNVILSAGNYPNFRANSGQYAGSSLDVDDITLVYTSKVQKLYVNNKEWKGFNPNSTEVQTYSLGQGATEMPEVYAVRGAGSLTNNRGGKANFPGRRLNNKECVIKKGAVDGDPTTITVTSEDGKSTTTYTIKFVSQASNNARLSDIKVNGESVSGFNAYLTSYNVSLPFGTTEVPSVEATAQDGTAKIQITQASSTSGKATILVTAGDGSTTMTYYIAFSVAALNDATLKAIYADGNLLPGYTPTKSNYVVSLPLGTTTAPALTWESAYASGLQTIKLLNNTLDGGAQIQVSITGGTATKTYKITYKIEASSYSYLAGIALDGTALTGFEPEKTNYTISLPMGATALPKISWTQGDQYQTVKLTEGGVDGITTIEVTAASGAKTTYRLIFQTEKSTNNALAAIALDGKALEGFDPETLEYLITLPAGSTSLPVITYTTGDSYQKVSLFSNQSQMTARLTVTAGDGSTRVYKLTFEIEKYENAFLQMIYLNGKELPGFDSEILDYSLVWTEATMPKVTVKEDLGQSISIATPSTYGVVRIVVTPEGGTPNTYTIRLNSPDEVTLPAFPEDAFPASNNAQLKELYIDGKKYEAFEADKYKYDYALPLHTFQVPALMPVAATKGQTITIEQGAVNAPTTITVLAADKKTKQVYTILFNSPKSSNTALASVEIEGVNFEFDPAKKEYKNLLLPYGTTVSPSLTVERAEPGQALTITEAPLGTPSTIVVTAEDGTQATYSFSYQIDFPDKANELVSIVLDGIGALDMSQAPNFIVDLPFGTTSVDIVSIVKNYPEQEVQVINGGVYGLTTITVKSLNPAEEDKVYTLTPNMYAYDPAMLLDIKVNGVSIEQFQPDIYNYVVSVAADAPVVTYTAQTGAEADDDMNEKSDTIYVESGEYSHKYVVTFYYPNDVTFDLTFDNFNQVTNEAITSEKTYCPKGWYAPINALTVDPASPNSYYPSGNTDRTTTCKQGSYALQLETTYLTTSADAMPGFVSLSQPTVTVGRWYMGIGFGVSYSSTMAFGSPISFRNTPDQIQLDYYYQESKNNANAWRFIYTANGEKLVNYQQDFSSLSKNQWYTLTQDITYSAGHIPATLDILISAAPSDNLSDYYTNFGVSRSTSKMIVDNLRLNYNSELKSLKVNGGSATQSGKAFTATIDADYYGTPQLAFEHAVADQMPIVNWSKETNGVRTATIKNYAEDLSSTDYTLTVTRPKSKNTNCVYELNGRDLTVKKGSHYQTVTVTTNDTAYVITVKAENGDEKVYYAAWTAAAGDGTAKVTKIEAENPIKGVSTARLINIETEPALNYALEYPLDSVAMLATDTCYFLHVFGSTNDTTYVIDRHASRNAFLASMSTNGQSVPDFYEETYDYVVPVPSLDTIYATPQDAGADVQYAYVPIDNAHTAVFVLVTAADGKTQKRYSVLVKIHELASDAYLTAINADDEMLTGFQSTKYDYTIELPAGSVIPQLSSIVCAGASVEMNTVRTGSSAVVTFIVTAENGINKQTYTVHVNVMPSTICTLSELFVGDGALTNFGSDKYDYAIELPYGTTELPLIDYMLTDKHSTATMDPKDKTVTILVTAEDGVHTNIYTIVFTIAKSTDAFLKNIFVDSVAIANFFAEEYTYTVLLPYGATLPTITAETADPAATLVIQDSVITVTAEDGVTTHTYTLNFTFAPSENALLLALNIDDKLQTGFSPEVFEYNDTVYFGQPLPLITWVTGDEQQQVDTTWNGDTQLLITVTAGDGMTISEYTLTFAHMLSPNCYLKDLQVLGATITGFHRDSLEYTIVYPVGTDSASLCSIKDIIAIPEDEGATVSVSVEDNVLQIFVTAPDGSIKVYTITQQILLSAEARLKMIWLDDKEVRAFHMDSLHYTVILPQGAILPQIEAATVDTLAEWELGMEQEIENGKQVEIYTEAQNGQSMTYVLEFQYAAWTPSSTADTDDYLFFPIGGGQYKAVTIGVGIQIAIYDMNGSLQMIQTLPVADPGDVVVEVDQQGEQRLLRADPGADGIIFTAAPGKIYFYVFYDSKTKKIAKGGKFGLQK